MSTPSTSNNNKRSAEELTNGATEPAAKCADNGEAIQGGASAEEVASLPVYDAATFGIKVPAQDEAGQPIKDEEGKQVMWTLNHKPKTKKGKIAYADVNGVQPVLVKTRKTRIGGMSRWGDKNKKDGAKGAGGATGKGAAEATDAAATEAASGDADSSKPKLTISLQPEDEAGLTGFQNDIPGYLLENKPLLNSLFGEQEVLHEDLRQDKKTLRLGLQTFVKPGNAKKEKDSDKVIMENGKPALWPATMYVNVEVCSAGKPCLEIYQESNEDGVEPKLLYAHYDNEEMNEAYRMAVQATAESTGTQITEADPYELTKNPNATVVMRYLGLYQVAKYGPSWRVVQVILSPPKEKTAAVQPGKCLLIRKTPAVV